jgi:hypothetical protein
MKIMTKQGIETRDCHFGTKAQCDGTMLWMKVPSSPL